MLPDGVHLVNIGAAREQELRGLLLLSERDRRYRIRSEGRCAAGDQHDHKVARACLIRHRCQPAGTFDTGFVRHWMAGLGNLDAFERQAVPVFSDD
jgi:hypothetical protein